MSLRKTLACILLLAICQQSLAASSFFDNGEWSAELGAEWRYFNDPGEFGQARSALSVSGQLEYYSSWNDRDDSLTFTPFIRVDQIDDNRSHVDLREAYWGHVGNNWETKLGVSRVFWGKTEFLNLVDVINQKDFVEGDTTKKLGQPLMQLSLVHEFGILDIYALFGFRERTFQGEEGRLRTPIVIDTDNARYDGVEPGNLDVAMRWSLQVTDNLEMAVSLFSGTNREPRFDFNYDLNDPKLIPVYSQMDQFGVEMEYILEGWVGKMEMVSVDTPRENYFAGVVGVEYTFSEVFESAIDVTFISEYLWDERGADSAGFLERDLAFGTRITFNDEQSTEMMLGGMYDVDTKEALYSLEASRRLGDSWRIALLAMVIGERADGELGQTVSEIGTQLLDSGFLEGGLDTELAIDLIVDIVKENGLLFLLTEINTYEDFIDTLQQAQKLSNTDRKLSLLESDDYIQIELKYFY